MTEKKSLKRRVRARMSKTGERYAAARRQMLARSSPSPAPPPAPRDDALIVARTGRPWAEWFAILAAWGAADRPHGEIARHLNDALGVDGWWSQNITVEFERAIGRRQVGQRADGTFVATASKTIGVAAEAAFDAFADEAVRGRWLADTPLRLRGATPHRIVRFDWADGPERVQVTFDPKAEGRTLVALEHQRLADGEAVKGSKAFWKDRLADLQRFLDG
ncbi:MAG: hypothetical protein FIA92_01685 [Chloroflexi bacterium]|nr:hypothetical protein [Chloroflexota bacterium]